MIYPQGVWYGKVTESDVERILDQTIEQGEILQDLLIPDEMLNTKGLGPDAAGQGKADA